MKKYLFGIIVLMILIFSSVVVSNFNIESVESLLRPPKNAGENAEIQMAFEESVADQYSLRSPLSGDYRSSFILVDLNDDGEEEVVVFYNKSSAVETIRMNILHLTNGEWKSIADFESFHSDVHMVDFADLYGDGNKEIIVGWSAYDQELNKTLCVYKIDFSQQEHMIDKVFSKKYADYMVCDIDNDSKSDILLFEKTSNAPIRGIKASYLNFKTKRVYISGEYVLDPNINSVVSVCFDNDPVNNFKRFYVDGYKADSGITTDVFYWNNNEKNFNRFNNDKSVSLVTLASRTTNVCCSDIDSDSLIEIPFEFSIPCSTVLSSDGSTDGEQVVVGWMKSSEREFIASEYELINASKSYSLIIHDDLIGRFTVKNDLNKGVITFYELLHDETPESHGKPKPKNEKNDKGSMYDAFLPGEQPEEHSEGESPVGKAYSTGKALFSILATAENDENLYELSGYRYIRRDNGYSYYCKIYDDGKDFGISKETIKKMLVT